MDSATQVPNALSCNQINKSAPEQVKTDFGQSNKLQSTTALLISAMPDGRPGFVSELGLQPVTGDTFISQSECLGSLRLSIPAGCCPITHCILVNHGKSFHASPEPARSVDQAFYRIGKPINIVYQTL